MIDCCYGILINQLSVLVTTILIIIESLLLLIAKIKFDSPREIKDQRKSMRVKEIEKRKSSQNLAELTEVIIEIDGEDNTD